MPGKVPNLDGPANRLVPPAPLAHRRLTTEAVSDSRRAAGRDDRQAVPPTSLPTGSSASRRGLVVPATGGGPAMHGVGGGRAGAGGGGGRRAPRPGGGG